MSELQLICFTRLFGITTVPHLNLDMPCLHSLLKALPQEDTALITTLWRGQANHCVRFSKIVDENAGVYEVMCPAFRSSPTMQQVTFTDLMQWGFKIFMLNRGAPSGKQSPARSHPCAAQKGS